MEQLLSHLIGDFAVQSAWMANKKLKLYLPAFVHSLFYYIPFYFMIRPSLPASIVIIVTHAIIDRFRLAKYVCYAKEFLSPPSEWKAWEDCCETGYYKETPQWLAVWLMIIVDNTIHMAINYWAILHL